MIEAAAPADISPLGVGGPLRFSRLSDELLARHVARGSDRAFTVLYERYHQRLYGYCRSIVRNDTDAQDALQAAFMGALAALKRRQRNAPLRPWLFRIAHNEAISVIRRRGRDEEPQGAESDLLTAPSAEDQADDRARWALLTDDLAELPERLRAALLLRELSGLSHAEIATTLDTTVGGAKQAIFDARRALAEFSAGRAIECDQVCQRLSAGDGRILKGRPIRAHLRDCASCRDFAAAIPVRRADLRAFAPALPPAAAAAVLSHSIGAVGGHMGAAGGSASALSTATTAIAVGKTAGTVAAWKALATGAAVLVAAAAGGAGLVHVLHHNSSARPATRPSGAPRPMHSTVQPGTVLGKTGRHTTSSRGPAATTLHHQAATSAGKQRPPHGGRGAKRASNTSQAHGLSGTTAPRGAGQSAAHRNSGSHPTSTLGRSGSRAGGASRVRKTHAPKVQRPTPPSLRRAPKPPNPARPDLFTKPGPRRSQARAHTHQTPASAGNGNSSNH